MRALFEAVTEELDAKLELDAATEAAHAFNDEFEIETDALADRRSRLYVLPLKLWDVTLDRRLCPQCAAHAGEVRPWGIPFSRGERPGAAHPRCRCRAATLLLATPGTERRGSNSNEGG